MAMTIAGRPIGGSAPTFIIAEIGVNHGGDEAQCAALIDAAAATGADAIKLQTVTPAESYHPRTESYRIFSQTELPPDALPRLMARAAERDVVLFSTPGDFDALAMLLAANVPAIKISSGLLTNTPLIARAAATGKPLILSTGMAHMSEIEAAVTTARDAGAGGLALLQCTSLYPAPPATLNLAAMATLAAEFHVPVGYSDHCDGALACIAAVAAGAKLIEKHFTMDASQPGADHHISLEPGPFAAMVREIRNVEAMLGSAQKAPTADEAPLRSGRHRRLAARRDIAVGETLAPQDIALMRLLPEAPGLEARNLDHVLGRRTVRPIACHAGIVAEDIEPAT